jgi:hypothetical protein
MIPESKLCLFPIFMLLTLLVKDFYLLISCRRLRDPILDRLPAESTEVIIGGGLDVSPNVWKVFIDFGVLPMFLVV